MNHKLQFCNKSLIQSETGNICLYARPHSILSRLSHYTPRVVNMGRGNGHVALPYGSPCLCPSREDAAQTRDAQNATRISVGSKLSARLYGKGLELLSAVGRDPMIRFVNVFQCECLRTKYWREYLSLHITEEEQHTGGETHTKGAS
jgi:hypothetical protein